MRKLIYLAILIPFIGCSQKDFDTHLKSYYNFTVDTVQPAQAKQFLDSSKSVHFLDTRSIQEYSVSKIGNAQFCNYNNPQLKKLTWAKTDTIVVYCTIGYRSEKIGEKLKALGYKNVFNLYGGIINWANHDQKVLTPAGMNTNKVHTYDKSWSKWLTNPKFKAIN